MNKLVFIFLVSISFFSLKAQEVSWACKVTSTNDLETDDSGNDWYCPRQALYIPDVYQSKKSASGRTYIFGYGSNEHNVRVSFEFCKAVLPKYLEIFEPKGPGSITKITLTGESLKKYVIFESEAMPAGELFRQWSIPINNINEKIKWVSLEAEPSKVKGWNCIDAIAITSLSKPLEVKINESNDLHLISKPEALPETVNSDYHEIVPIISPDNNTLYFDRKDHPDNFKKDNGVIKDDIWVSEKDKKGNWGKAVHLGAPLNNTGHNFVNAISVDKKTLLVGNQYNSDGSMSEGLSITKMQKDGSWALPIPLDIENFTNDNKYVNYFMHPNYQVLMMAIENDKSFGMKDIYVSFPKDCDGLSWTEPLNLGSTINTMQNEYTPFLAADEKTLYFASEGHYGYGSYDIFMSRRLDDSWTKWSEPVNLGPMINSSAGDMGFAVPASGDVVYTYTYIRKGDIVMSTIEKANSIRPYPVHIIKGKITDAQTGKPVKTNIYYELLKDGKKKGCVSSNEADGSYLILLPNGEHYGLHAEVDGYYTVNQNIDIKGEDAYKEVEINIEMMPIKEGKSFVLNNVFFIQSKAVLLSNSYPELNRLVTLLKNNTNLNIRIDGHTDNRGNFDDNMKLSEKRAQAIMNFLIKNGIDKKRLSFKAFGSTKPIADNENESTRKLNRRVEFTVMKD